MGFNIWIFLFGLSGIALGLFSLLSSILELHGLTLLKLNGPKRMAAISNIVRDIVVIICQGVIIHVAVSSILQNQSIDFKPWALISILLSCFLVVDRIRRIRIERYYDEQHIPNFSHRRKTDR